MAMLYLKDKEEVEWHEEAINMLKRASNLGNALANEYLRSNEHIIMQKH
jgi:hypothetical protein